MEENYKKLLSNASASEPSAFLLAKIMAGIKNEEKRAFRAKWQTALFSLSAVFSFIFLAFFAHAAQTEFQRSGFFQFFSLLFSDFGVVATYWQTFAISLLESLPIVPVVAILGIAMIFVASLKYLIKNIKTLRLNFINNAINLWI